MLKSSVLSGVAVLCGLTACAPPGEERQDEELRQLLERERQAHLTTDASLLAEGIADTVWSVEGGMVRAIARGELERSYASYFDGATYHEWDDLEPPVIQRSNDGSMAWVARRVTVHREAPAFGGGTRAERFVGAYVAAYTRRGGTWRMTAVASTFAEIPSAALVVAGARRAVLGLDGESPEFLRFEVEATGPGGDYGVAYVAGSDRSARIDFSTGMSAAITRDARWIVLEPGAAPVMLSDTLETFLRGHDLLMNVMDPEPRYGPMRFAGLVSFAGEPAIRVDGVDALGAPIQVYYAQSDTLPLGFRVVDHVRGRGPVETTLSDWTDVGSGRWPRSARFVQGDEIFDYRIVTVESTDEIDVGAFDPPPGDQE